ncbi:relaxase/mobilization nuclease domain-containing protein [Lactococcus garvieae]|uniref:relaxase/mobilization nuclease domain-containing protein n=1 Tax=Lactococcus garvieae TaxID=1363 RepID=UPI001E3C6366|nr:relaxase/mobilization nuclease domain-containing protein [Lactococcus garvieae]UHU65959.1 relaxase/mobilization nuclease domain-containing protein [Lactococcus garvieae]
MPTTKTGQIKSESHFHNAVKYILNPDKTNEQVLTSGYQIQNINNAEYEMNLLRRLARDARGNSSKSGTEVLAHHIKQNFSPDDKLSPEEIHEIGRQTVLELTGGNHEFIIATHVDRDHIHNHIIFNTTSSQDLKKFRWQKGTPELLRNISDKISDYHQAKVLPPLDRSSYSKYQKYLASDAVRPEIQKRMNFLLRHSTDKEDLIIKAQKLNLKIDFSGKYATYLLLDKEQKRAVRETSLDKKAAKKKEKSKYSWSKIEKCLEKNELVFSKDEIQEEYEKLNQWIDNNPDIKLEVEPWQIDKVSPTGLYIHLKVANHYGTVKIPNVKFDRLNNGNYEIHIKQNQKFFFLDERKSQDSKKVYGVTVIKQLSKDSQIEPQYRSRAMESVQYLANAWALLENHHVSSDEAFEHLGETFIQDMEKVDQALEKLDQKIIEYHEAIKFNQEDISLSKIQSLQLEREELQEAYDDILVQFNIYDDMKNLTNERKKQENIEVLKR